MKVFHLSFHLGCIRSINALMRDLGHELEYMYARPEIPYAITSGVADTIWEKYGAKWNTYDLILTSDTAALSYIFLRHLGELKPKLLIWVCNRFDYSMGDVPEYYELLRKVTHGREWVNKVKVVPYTEYERIHCGKHKIWVREPVLLPYGKVEGTKVFNGQVDSEKPLELDTSGMTAPKDETVFVSFYNNESNFLPIKDILKSQGISVVGGEFRCIEDLKGYKAIVTLPDAFSKFFYFELLNIQLPIFIPTEEFFMELNPLYRPNGKGDYYKYCFTIDNNVVPPYYIDMCEWYKYPNERLFFESLDDLIQKLRSFTKEDGAMIRRRQKANAEFHNAQVLATAKKILADFEN